MDVLTSISFYFFIFLIIVICCLTGFMIAEKILQKYGG